MADSGAGVVSHDTDYDETYNCCEFYTKFLYPISSDLRKDVVDLIHTLSKADANDVNVLDKCNDIMLRVETELGKEHIVCEFLAQEMAECLRKLGLIDGAIEFINDRMGRTGKKDFGCLLTLATIYEQAGEYQKGASPRRDVLKVANDSGDPILISLALVKQACNFWHLQKPDEAKENIALCKEKLEICNVSLKETSFPFSESTLRLIDLYKTLAYIHRFLEGRTHSASYYEKALAIVEQDEKALVHRFKLESQIACQYSHLKNKNEAEKYCLRAYERIKEIAEVNKFMTQHALTAIRALSRCAFSLQSVGKYEQVLKIKEYTYTIAEKNLRCDHPEVARIAADIAFFCSNVWKSDKDVLYINRAEAALENCGCVDLKLYAREISDAWKSLALLYSNGRQYEKAEKCYKETLRVNTKVYGGNHPRISRVYMSMGKMYRNFNMFSEAVHCFRKCKAISDEFTPNDTALRKKLQTLIHTTLHVEKKSLCN